MKITIKVKNNKVCCKTNAEDVTQVIKAIEYVNKRPDTRVRTYKRTQLLRVLKKIHCRTAYVLKAVKKACSKNFVVEDINRHQYECF